MGRLRIAGSLASQIQTDLGVLQNRWLHIPSILLFVRFYHFIWSWSLSDAGCMSCNTNMHSDHIHLVWPLPTFVLHLFFSFFFFFLRRWSSWIKPLLLVSWMLLRTKMQEMGRLQGPGVQTWEPEEEGGIAQMGQRKKSFNFAATFLLQTSS